MAKVTLVCVCVLFLLGVRCLNPCFSQEPHDLRLSDRGRGQGWGKHIRNSEDRARQPGFLRGPQKKIEKVTATINIKYPAPSLPRLQYIAGGA